MTTKPTVLFLCVHNAGRSLAARVLLEHYAQGRLVVESAGSEPGGQLNPSVVAILKERGLDPTLDFPKPLTDESARAADVIVTMGCGDTCPMYPGKRYEDWELDDPAGLSVEEVRPIVDEIDRRVQMLLAELQAPSRQIHCAGRSGWAPFQSNWFLEQTAGGGRPDRSRAGKPLCRPWRLGHPTSRDSDRPRPARQPEPSG